MNPKSILILLKNIDRTSEIERYFMDKNTLCVQFSKNPTIYHYKDYAIFEHPKILKCEICGVSEMLDFGKFVKFFLKNGTKLILKSNLESELKILKNARLLDYYREISSFVSLKNKNNEAFLQKELNKIDEISQDSALFYFLNPQIEPKKYALNQIIFPFSTNLSQMKAIQNALQHQISIIEGPPGTGKTQSILNIICNLLYQNKTIAILSNNNSSVQNVLEKLAEADLDYFCAMLGNAENKKNFITNQKNFLGYRKKPDKNANINDLIKRVKMIYNLQNKIAESKLALNAYRLELEHFLNSYPNVIMPKLKKRTNSKKILFCKIELENGSSFFKTLKNIFWRGIGDFKFYRDEQLFLRLNLAFYQTKIKELQKELSINQQHLNMLEKTQPLNALKEHSMRLLRAHLNEKFKDKNKIFSDDDLWRARIDSKKAKEFLKKYPVIFSTTHSTKQNLNIKFDYAIIDEASQVDLISGILALECAKNVVIVGDSKQLPNVIPIQDLSRIELISKKYNIDIKYDFKHSLLDSALMTFKSVPKILLKEHYRCHPNIIGFCNQKFYSNQLIILSPDCDCELKVILTSEGNHARRNYNQRQIDVIKKEILPNLKTKDIGIISPYNEQKNQLENQIECQIDTVHKYQGRQKEGIIITTVDNEISEFVDDGRMLNVAISRAKKYLYIVASMRALNSKTNIGDLIKYISYINCQNVECSRIKSIFDLLYRDNFKARLEYLKNKNKISHFDSENLAYNFIKEFLAKNNFSNISLACHIPLCEILNNVDLLNENERRFAANRLTHIDIMLFHSMDKSPILAIEIDGYFYHKQNKQAKRDRLKDEILNKYKIPLIRFSTIGSGESEILLQALKKLGLCYNA